MIGNLPPSKMPPDVAKEAASIVSSSPISAHQRGAALDYGTASNSEGDIRHILNFIRHNGYADFEMIDETRGPGPHIHVTVTSVTDKGYEFLRSQMKSEGRVASSSQGKRISTSRPRR